MERGGFVLKKEDVSSFLEHLKKQARVIAPVQKDILRHEPLEDVNDVVFEGLSEFPYKKYFFPNDEVIFFFNRDKIDTPKLNAPKTVLFGLRMCDTAGIAVNDKLFINDYPDKAYMQRRENTYLIPIYCYHEIDQYCFCSSMDLPELFDILFIDRQTHYHLKIGSEKGKKLFEKIHMSLKQEDFVPPKTECSKKLNTRDIKGIYDDQMWKTVGSDHCTSCEKCTAMCPTCLCFSIKDELNDDLESGQRSICHDSCLSKTFTLVAGNHVFRDEREFRFKHRIYHKLQYFPEKFDGMSMCTGCGRCIRSCENKIDWVNIINTVTEGKQ